MWRSSGKSKGQGHRRKKNRNSLFWQCKISMGSNSGSIEICVLSGVFGYGDRMEWLPPLSRDRKYTRSRVLSHMKRRSCFYIILMDCRKTFESGVEWWHCVFSSQNIISVWTFRPFCVIFMKFRHQWTDHLQQNVACTASTRAVTERFYTCTEHAPVLVRPSQLRRFTRFWLHWLTYILTYLLAQTYPNFCSHVDVSGTCAWWLLSS